MKENINYSFILEEDLHDIAKLYCRTFTGESFSSEELEAAVENIHKHTTYEGFIGLKATDLRGKLIGFSYGYRSFPGQFYGEKLEKQMTLEQASHWLKDCFEFVELAVDSSHKRKGVGSSLHDKTLDEVLNTTSVLITSIDNNPAIITTGKVLHAGFRGHATVEPFDKKIATSTPMAGPDSNEFGTTYDILVKQKDFHKATQILNKS
ncbi:Acetyltransferase (GNAT) family protein [Thalassobacillus cyri]|uniref:Acetyltransferase (GNAT) family protein n=1 Tax=Thalassobacillus cyri TaxID=571932 RepID=A0A1H4F420_9BACI|nr:GNAT family N-acetyltransferase [Thalassobacillus cyri]SEA91981.1 Acetyltransferase (GNAT) family protein [Thalassobacillus cyri]